MSGHWFCANCDDVVFNPAPVGRWDFKHGLTCPVCHKDTADWKADAPKKMNPVTAAALFAEMREACQ